MVFDSVTAGGDFSDSVKLDVFMATLVPMDIVEHLLRTAAA